jgi:hypothetical protein
MKNPRKRPIADTAQQIGFNTLTSKDKTLTTAKLEDIFSYFEKAAQPVIEKIKDSENLNLTDQERTDLAFYIGILAAANPRSRRVQGARVEKTEDIVESIKSNRDKLIDGFIKEYPELPDARERIENYIDNAEASAKGLKDDSANLSALSAFHIGIEKAKDLFYRKWELVTTAEPNYFILSDHPVIAPPPSDVAKEWEKEDYWELPFVLPLTPYIALHLIRRDEPDEVKQLSHDYVALVNKYSMIFAEDEVYSHTNSDKMKDAFGKTQKGQGDKFFID